MVIIRLIGKIFTIIINILPVIKKLWLPFDLAHRVKNACNKNGYKCIEDAIVDGKKLINNLQDEINKIRLDLIRDSIKLGIFMKLPLEMVLKDYDKYKSLGGNSYITELINWYKEEHINEQKKTKTRRNKMYN